MTPLQNKLMKEIFGVTRVIQKEFPELYEHLSETPLSLSNSDKEPTQADLRQYLNSLKEQLATFEKSSTPPPNA